MRDNLPDKVRRDGKTKAEAELEHEREVAEVRQNLIHGGAIDDSIAAEDPSQ